MKKIDIKRDRLEQTFTAYRVLVSGEMLLASKPTRIAISYIETENKQQVPNIILSPADAEYAAALAFATTIIKKRVEEANKILDDIGVKVSAPEAHASPTNGETQG